MRKTTIILLVSIISACNLYSAGTTGLNFLKIGVGARPIGMGGAFVGVADDLNAINWNPAGLASLKGREMSATHLTWIEGMSSQYAAFGTPLNNGKGAIGLSVNSISMGEIRGYDENDAPTAVVNAGGMAVGLTYAKGELMEGKKNLSGGITVRMVQETLADKSVSVPVVDIGILNKKASENGKMSLGINIQNLGSGAKYITDVDPLPQNIKVGIGYKSNEKTTLCADYNMPSDNAGYFCAGVEYQFNQMVKLRAGYKSGTDVDMGVRAGVGIWKDNIGLDYAYAGYGDLGITHRISLNYKLAAVEKPAKKKKAVKKVVKEVKKVEIEEEVDEEIADIEEPETPVEAVVVKEEVKPSKIETKSSVDTDKLYKKAEVYYSRGKIKESLLVLQEILKAEPKNERARDLFMKISMEKQK
ncbi:MAG: hypothetical protein A2252_06865 [Elusimicrobia bacterium RIFOXYA2_FULL_39_19]|nr:MAG: hypothetical protein A2252_06865 [Elusimicrobia bacterium RIFOXYA2_FULL_39_19]